MKDGEKIENTFEWFILTVEAGLAGSFPKDMDKRIDFCKKQIEAHKIAKNTEQANQPDSGSGRTCGKTTPCVQCEYCP